jgi:chemotaxis protein CheD
VHKEIFKQSERVTLDPGEFYATRGIGVISTVLGSCVAACLYDPGLKLIGMNHFMLSSTRYSRELPVQVTEAGQYGMHAMELLINAMMAMGTDRSRLRAKVFGGASILHRKSGDNFFCVGPANARFIHEYLRKEGIPIDAEDLGGDFGRVIHFSNGDFVVHRRKVGPQRSARIGGRDRDVWQRAIERQQQEERQPAIEIW